MKIFLKTTSEKKTFELASSLAYYVKPGTVLLLDGDLAAGKTVFAKGLGAGLGVTEHIKSPSYTLLCMYEGRLPLYHFDAYNLNGIDDFYDLGFNEYLESDGVALIEWASVISEGFSWGAIHIDISKDMENENLREMVFTATDDFHESILKEWRQNENVSL